MRYKDTTGVFKVHAIAGTHTILIALDCEEKHRHGLLGFAFKRERVDARQKGAKWLRSLKVFRSVVPDPDEKVRYSSWEHPIQSFLWGDYTAVPGAEYKFAIVPMYGKPGALKPGPSVDFKIRTEKEVARRHGIWFNRGSIASQAFAREYGNRGPQPENNPDPKDPVTIWLSRGLLEACLSFIHRTPRGQGLRVAAYEFTYAPVLEALGKAIERGVDVRIVYHDTTREKGTNKGANEKAIDAAGLKKRMNRRQVLYPRSKTKIPHNKFIVRLDKKGKPTRVWTGSTNFTPSGFLGQSNVGHLVADKTTAGQYLDYWNLLKGNPNRTRARAGAMKLTPHPPELVGRKSITRIFSPRPKSVMLNWYGDRIDDARETVMFTAAFGVTRKLVPPLAKDRDFLRFILMEKPPSTSLAKDLSGDRDLVTAYGTALGQIYTFKNGKPVARKRIKEFELDKWLLREDHYRHEGFVFFVHTKFLLVDPLSDDPLICTGSANFSPGSLLDNDENMLLIRGDKRVADIYMTEFDRIFRHFYFRDIANELAARGSTAARTPFLKDTDVWTEPYFEPGAFKSRRRELFFSDPTRSWVSNAARRGG